MSDSKNPLEKYKGKPYPPLEKMKQSPQLVKADTDYKAFEEMKRGNRSPRFKIVDANGVSYGCSYSHLLDWIYKPPTLLTLNTATRIYTIEGRNLDHIERLLMDERMKAIYAFNAEKHIQPENNKTIIEKLEITEQ